MPGGQYFQGVNAVIGKIIKEYVTQPTADNDGEDEDKIEIFKFTGKVFVVVVSYLLADEKVTCGKTQDIHQTVPPNLQRSEAEKNGIYGRKGHGDPIVVSGEPGGWKWRLE